MNCYLCNIDSLKLIRTKLRHGISRRVLECQNCGIIYLEPKEIIAKDYYEHTYRKFYTPVIGKVLSSRETFEIYLPYQQRRIEELKHILNPRMKALDVGCSAGHFLFALKDYVQECIGIEFNNEDAKFVNKKLGIKTYTTPIQNTDIPFEYFDLITAFQVLEHIDDPIKVLSILYKYLKPEGYIYIEVPNIQDALISLYHIKSYADFWFREPHIFYYSPKTLSMVLERSGFSGNTKTIQNYNFINQINWILTGRPQKSADIGMSIPRLINSDSVDKTIKEKFNRWIKRVDEEYKQLLNRYDLGDSILFIGKKII